MQATATESSGALDDRGAGEHWEVRSTIRPLAYSVPEAARALGIGKTTAYEAVAAGEIPSIRIRGRVLVPRAALERLLSGTA